MLRSRWRSYIIVPTATQMLVFGHMGITLAGALVLDAMLSRRHGAGVPMAVQPVPAPQTTRPPTPSVSAPSARLRSLADHIDIRILLVGSLLSDIIDKPIGRFLFRETFDNGRIFAHTLVFLILLTVIGLYMYKKRSSLTGLVLSFAVLIHLFLDAMWWTPQTLLWPVYGFSFEKRYTELYSWSGMQQALEKVLANPILALPELFGALVLIWFVWQLAKTRRLHVFLRYGRI
jgi:inner membrane protein